MVESRNFYITRGDDDQSETGTPPQGYPRRRVKKTWVGKPTTLRNLRRHFSRLALVGKQIETCRIRKLSSRRDLAHEIGTTTWRRTDWSKTRNRSRPYSPRQQAPRWLVSNEPRSEQDRPVRESAKRPQRRPRRTRRYVAGRSEDVFVPGPLGRGQVEAPSGCLRSSGSFDTSHLVVPARSASQNRQRANAWDFWDFGEADRINRSREELPWKLRGFKLVDGFLRNSGHLGTAATADLLKLLQPLDRVLLVIHRLVGHAQVIDGCPQVAV